MLPLMGKTVSIILYFYTVMKKMCRNKIQITLFVKLLIALFLKTKRKNGTTDILPHHSFED